MSCKVSRGIKPAFIECLLCACYSRHYHPHFIDWETEAQRAQIFKVTQVVDGPAGLKTQLQADSQVSEWWNEHGL